CDWDDGTMRGGACKHTVDICRDKELYNGGRLADSMFSGLLPSVCVLDDGDPGGQIRCEGIDLFVDIVGVDILHVDLEVDLHLMLPLSVPVRHLQTAELRLAEVIKAVQCLLVLVHHVQIAAGKVLIMLDA